MTAPSVGSLSLSLSRGQSQFGGRLSGEPVPQSVSSGVSLSSDEEEILDAALSPRNFRIPGNGNGNGNGNGHGSGNGNSNGNGNKHGNGKGNVISTGNTQAFKPAAPKSDDFYGVKKIGEEVIFVARFDRARKVLIAGDFNNWSPMSTPMVNRGRPGEFYMSLPLPAGRYRYRFVVDGKWMTDPHNKYVEVNQFGELNNVVDVE